MLNQQQPTECVCTSPGYCRLMDREMSETRWQECKHSPHYFEMFLAEVNARRERQKRPPRNDTAEHEEIPIEGPGTELKALLSRIGIKAKKNCGCQQHANVMNINGVAWCNENIDKIVGWLEVEAKKQGKPFLRLPAVALVKLAIRNAKKRQKELEREEFKNIKKPEDGKPRKSINRYAQKPKEIKWSYGVTTVPERIHDLLPNTLRSLKGAGFPSPRLFVDDCENASQYSHFGLDVTTRFPRIRTFGNWVLAAWELYVRDPHSTYYAIFQDDFVTYKNLRQYLEKIEYPEDGYLNLYTFPSNQDLAPKDQIGFYRSNQLGKGAVALVFSRHAIMKLLESDYLIQRPQNLNRGHKAVDGGIVTALSRKGIYEYVHNPSLTQHHGIKSSMGNKKQPLAKSFEGETFDAMDMLK